jgi:hypothetical protein
MDEDFLCHQGSVREPSVPNRLQIQATADRARIPQHPVRFVLMSLSGRHTIAASKVAKRFAFGDNSSCLASFEAVRVFPALRCAGEKINGKIVMRYVDELSK